MSAPKHTPGPWRFTDDIIGGATMGFDVMASDAAGEPICVAGDLSSKANAHIIAAAPDLLSVARRYVDSQDDCIIGGDADRETCGCVTCDLTRSARAAIAKAEGKS